MRKKISLLVIILLGMISFAGAQPCIPNSSSLDFNGISSAVRITPGANLEITDQLTIEAWVYARSFASSPTGGSIFCKHSWNPSMYGYVLRAGGAGVLSFNLAGAVGGSPVGWEEVTSNVNAISLNTWTHVAGTFDGNTMSCYVNGILSGSFSFSGGIYPSTGLPPRIGALADTNWGMSRYWDGYIDEVRVWNRALSGTEILAGMNDHLDPATAMQLAGYWRFNDIPNAIIQDYSANNYPGLMLGSNWTSQVPFNNPIPATPTITYVAGQLHASAATSYQWYFGSSLINGATQQNYTPAQYGNYSVEVGGPTGCTNMSVPFNYNTTGLEEANPVMLTLSPNPARSSVWLSVSDDYLDSEVQIFSLSGQLVQSLRISQKPVQEIDISHLTPGLYFLKLTNDGETRAGKLMVW